MEYCGSEEKRCAVWSTVDQKRREEKRGAAWSTVKQKRREERCRVECCGRCIGEKRGVAWRRVRIVCVCWEGASV